MITNNELKEKFEVNLLDGDRVEDCGNTMLSAESVWEFVSENFTEMVEGELRDFARWYGVKQNEIEIKMDKMVMEYLSQERTGE